MDRFITVFAFVAVSASIGFANPISSEYGVPFDTYGPPPSGDFVPLHRTINLPPIELPPPVKRIIISEVPVQPLHHLIDLPPIELPPPVERIVVVEKPILPTEYLSELSPIELPPPVKTLSISPEYPIVDHEEFPLELPPPVDLFLRSETPESRETAPLELPSPVHIDVRTAEIKPDIVTKGEVVAPPNTKVHLRDDKNQYSVGFQNPDGTEVNEQGRLISTDNGWEYVIAKTGSYRYVSPEGIPISVNWVADEKGFRVLPNDA